MNRRSRTGSSRRRRRVGTTRRVQPRRRSREPEDLLPLVKEQLVSDSAWQIRGPGGRWCCPFCGELTEIVIPASGVTQDILEQIAAKISSCEGFDPERPDDSIAAETLEFQISQMAEVRAAAEERIRQRDAARARLVERMRKLIDEFPVWRVVDERDRWLCPYCREPVESVQASSLSEHSRDSPDKVVEHLLANCAAYREKRPVVEKAEELQRTVTFGRVLGDLAEATEERPRELSITSRLPRMERETTVDEIEQDLLQAKARQEKMLAQMPEVEGYTFGVHFEPCQFLGGDFYDCFKLRDGRIGLAVGDVTGHGVNAALVASVCRKVLRMTAKVMDSPREVLALANDEIKEDLDGQTFVSLVYAVLDTENHTMVKVRAGHEPMLRYSPSREALDAYEGGGMAVGLTTGARFRDSLIEETIELAPGDTCLFYTDGATEAQRADQTQFGRECLEAAMELAAEMTAQQLVDGLVTGVRSFVAGHPLEDDLTLLAVQRLA